MPQSASVYSLTSDLKPERRWGFWVLLLLLALLIHLLFFLTHVDWGTPKAPPRVDVTQVDPRKLEEIRKRWKEQEKTSPQDKYLNDEKPMLKSKDQKAADKAPDNARYMSDRNIHVEQEQRARQDMTQPKIGERNHTGDTAKKQAEAQPEIKAQPQTKTHPQTVPNLGNLGVPFHLDKQQPKPQNARKAQEASSSEKEFGGKQFIDDKSLPEGSENILNAEESVFYSFYSRLYDAIGPNWASRVRSSNPPTQLQPGRYTTSVDVVLDREGNLVEVRFLQSSGVKAFDEAVNVAWATIGKFPNPPSGLIKEDGNVHTAWSFTIDLGGGAGLMLMPPERTN